MKRLRPLLTHPLFLIGVLIRLALMATMAPAPISAWYAPFLEFSSNAPMPDPWSGWLASGGTPAAFPYGYAMWLAFLPMALLAKLTALPLHWVYSLTLLAADACLLLVLDKLVTDRRRLLLCIYWLSPVVILATYGLGYNDVLPALLLVTGVWCVRQARLEWAGILLACAVSAKLSMVIALPFFAIYLFHHRALRQRSRAFVLGFGAGALVLFLPFLASGGAVQMLAGSPEMVKVYQLALHIGPGFTVYAVPLVYLMLLYFTWRLRRLNFDIFQATIALAFLALVLMTPAAPGWFLWSLPFLCVYQAMSGQTAILLTAAFSILYAVSTLLAMPLVLKNGNVFALGQLVPVADLLSGRLVSLLHTAMVAVGAILSIRIWREAVGGADYFRLSRKPFVLGVAGDSGAGKDTYVDAIAGLFGQHSTVRLSGDNYHLWDRQKPMWQMMTHLNPMANDLEGYSRDLVSLADGKTIHLKHYDHHTGRMSKPVRTSSNDFILASGLHALYLPILRDCCNLKVYLDIDEGLRRHFKLQRDVHQRGHSVDKVLAALDKRAPDAQQFIRPQADHADLIFSLQPIRPGTLGDVNDQRPVRLKLVVRSRQSFDERAIYRVLVGLCGLHVDMHNGNSGQEAGMTIEGETCAADMALAAQLLCPRMQDFLDIPPRWLDGPLGLMQLLTLSHINQAFTKRILS